ncbi:MULTISPECIES: hypothetical protein [Mycobacteroides]|uniref:hypothetical protein n=1 Tax=Mycobacteroides TaxID=670516 RepID=UPI0007F96F24|nr:hypothetical protein [Mycobacteroides abscessus]QRJ69350.1 hypothetical protein PHIT45-1_61 [Mycobacterium phage phiT45-1]ANO20621.1 hypothetical protein BAB78_20270 [Mycobacteroides abscessus]MDM3924345.1 hypothetical protein [Mycobacteroides abscessus]MDO2967710.1 hypothetical protein [Mycobacteroides abscessus subsp. abscessus]MDO3027374.1 hypothetical protein [Mycobacteroides abscessus subsp. abscessus]
MSELRNDWRLPDPPDLSGWHDVGRIVNGINPALPDLDPRITLSAQLHRRVKFTNDEVYLDHLASLFYRDVDLASFEWSDEMRKLPGQFDDRPHFGDSRARRIISEALAGQ